MVPIPALDGLRATAILIVMLSHAGLGRVVPGGFGVTIFFFLSGYLITTILRLEAAATGTISLSAFYAKRFWRIIPPFAVSGATVILLIATGVLRAPITLSGLTADALFLSNYAPDLNIGGTLPMPLWSLNVEEHFYILFSAVFLLVLAPGTPRRAALLCGAACLGFLLLRVALALRGVELDRMFYWSHTRMDSILFGSCLALWNNPVVDRDAWRPRWPSVAVALGALAICLVVRDEVFRQTLRYSVQGVALFVLFSYAIQAKGPIARVLGSRALRAVALLSYTLYLIHMPLVLLAEQHRLPLPDAVGLLLAFAYAWAMYLLVERPISRWRRQR